MRARIHTRIHKESMSTHDQQYEKCVHRQIGKSFIKDKKLKYP